MDTIAAAHVASAAAALGANASTSDPGNTLEASAAVRSAAEDKLSAAQTEFDRKHERNAKKLDALSAELDALDPAPLSEQVGAAPSLVERGQRLLSFLHI